MAKPEDFSAAQWDLYVARKLNSKAQNAKERGIEFKLTFQAMKNLLSAKKCYYTGISLTKGEGSAAAKASDLTIDRIDCEKGYEKGNVVACCHAFNQMKSYVEKSGLQGIKVTQKAFGKVIKRMEK